MKTQFTLPFFMLALIVRSTVTIAQITITSADASALNASGNIMRNHIDTTITAINIGATGATSWDFSGLNSHISNVFTYVVPSSTPYYLSDFPSSNVTFTFTETIGKNTSDGWKYETQSSGAQSTNGIVNKSTLLTDILLVKSVYSPAQLDMLLPFTYNSQWGSNFVVTSTTYLNDIPYSNASANHSETVVVDAYGSMTMPGGIVLDALRVQHNDTFISNGISVNTISYSFLTKSGSGVHVVAINSSSPNFGTIPINKAAWVLNGNLVGIQNQDQNQLLFSLSQNYPNPFNTSTRINYTIPDYSFVNIKLYDFLGSEVATLVNEKKSAGRYEVEFDGSKLPLGVYFYKLEAGNFVKMKKMILLKK